ncbi:hypothetical protein Thimo_3325 [Thioflavicoccus mobilis 8321]|uniref:Uncharacterized protein n=1 Tax=Thioflavicoccus mobilis 8321 TaxID=765912 RepID=L0H1U2_9GAMM|nr:hypothetical protein Thimo_3325 [Thioflavicoccus mobilis 8321]
MSGAEDGAVSTEKASGPRRGPPAGACQSLAPSAAWAAASRATGTRGAEQET